MRPRNCDCQFRKVIFTFFISTENNITWLKENNNNNNNNDDDVK